MNTQLISEISKAIGAENWQIKNTLDLIHEDCTVHFIARYRKEKTGNLDEEKIREIINAEKKLVELEKRKDSILESIREQGKLSKELELKIQNCISSNELEDLYLPFKQKRKTRAEIARQKGLEPLAKMIASQKGDISSHTINRFLNKDVESIEKAVAGAKDIIAEWINELASIRNSVRRIFMRNSVIKSKIIKDKENDAEKYRDYFAFEQSMHKCHSHRVHAIFRAEKEGFLRVKLRPNKEEVLEMIQNRMIKNKSPENSSSLWINEAISDSYTRLIAPSIETEFRNYLKEKADKSAISVFAKNLRSLLLAPPLGQKRILAIDPGFRTGCKVVCLDNQGNLMHNETIFPHKPQSETKQAARKISSMISAYKTEAIAIGNGTAGRKTENFIKRLKLDREVQVFVVNEDGASVYSASKIAREEFPKYDVTVRGAVSIGRRLMDPLSELVKIDPKSIGVGQYQHDIDAKLLKESLDNVVLDTVNSVGVNLNTASKYLISYISGLGKQLAENIVEHRKSHGLFENRESLKSVKGLGKKAFEQAAGFLRIPNSNNKLDNTAIHPETYHIVENISKKLNLSISELIDNKTILDSIDSSEFSNEKFGEQTIADIINELKKPNRDPRKTARVFEFDKRLRNIVDLEIGQIVPGIVTNVTRFGAFVDIGIKENGLIHISNIREEYISDPAEILSVHDHLQVKIIEVDTDRKRIQLSIKDVKQN